MGGKGRYLWIGMLVIENSWSKLTAESGGSAVVMVKDHGRLASQPPPVLSRRPKRGSAAAGETAGSRKLSSKSRRHIGISERENVPSWDGQRRRLGAPQDAERLSRSSWRWQCIKHP
jgi:hypothetical protein